MVPAPDSIPKGTPMVDSSASTTSAVTTDKEKTVMEILTEIKATLDHVLAKGRCNPTSSDPYHGLV